LYRRTTDSDPFLVPRKPRTH
jgi:hypothetical protein